MAIANMRVVHRELAWDDSEHQSDSFLGQPTLDDVAAFISDESEFTLSQDDYDRLIAGETLDHFVSRPVSKPDGQRYRVWIDSGE